MTLKSVGINSAFVLVSAAVSATVFATTALAQSSRATSFKSPNGIIEQCAPIAAIPNGVYSEKDQEQENFFCSIDLYSPEVAACPKFWSTSAGTIFVETKGSGLTSRQYEAQRCAKKDGHEKLAKFKSTMNASGTSGTFAPSSLLYYHFSRYFNTDLKVPVSVYRTFDKDAHFDRVSSVAKGKGAMNIAAWKILGTAEKNPSTYKPTADLFTPDLKQIHGILLRDKGERYGAEFNGTRAGGWGDGQNNSFQVTPGFMALRSERQLESAIADGIAGAMKDPAMKTAVGTSPISGLQMVFWMNEITEITLLDYIFSQQDRIGNIDYIWTWYYVEGGKLKNKDEKKGKDLPRTKMASIQPPAEIAAFKPILVQRTSIGDNDAGGRVQYTNYTKRTKMLEKIRHYNADTYRRLIAMNEDFKKGGDISKWLKSNIRLTEKEVEQIKANTASAAKILQDTCVAGNLQFDLDAKAYFMGQSKAEQVDCLRP
jgi:hypothetical protein